MLTVGARITLVILSVYVLFFIAYVYEAMKRKDIFCGCCAIIIAMLNTGLVINAALSEMSNDICFILGFISLMWLLFAFGHFQSMNKTTRT